MHRHSAWQLTASLFGEFRFRMVEQTVFLKPGDWVLMAPELLHDAGSDSPSSHAIQIFSAGFRRTFFPNSPNGSICGGESAAADTSAPPS